MADASRSRDGTHRAAVALALLLGVAGAARSEDDLGKAQAAYDAGDYAKAAALAETVAKKDPDAASYLLLGKALMRAGKAESALSAFDAALKQDPGLEGAHFFCGTLLAKQGKKTEAEKELLEEIEVSPRSAQTHYALALVRRDLGKREQAVQSFLRCLDGDPQNATARKLLIATELDLRRANDAALQIGKLPKDDKDLPSLAYNVALLFFSKKADARAAALLRQAVSADPNYAKAHYLLGLTLARQGKRDEARTELSRYLELEPQSEEAAEARKVLSQLG